MPSELLLVILRLSFLAVMWIFVFAIIIAVRSDMFGPKVRIARVAGDDLASSSAGAGAFAATASPMPAAVDPQQRSTQDVSALGQGAEPAGAGVRPHVLVITEGTKKGATIALRDQPVTIGRSSDNTLTIIDDFTSGHHARLTPGPDGWTLEDLGSTNGTFVRQAKVTSPIAVSVGTPVTIGATTFELRA